MAYIILRLAEVIRRRGISRTTHYEDMEKGLYTKPVPIHTRVVGWPEYEEDALNAARIAGKTNDEIRDLVKELMNNRKFAA